MCLSMNIYIHIYIFTFFVYFCYIFAPLFPWGAPPGAVAAEPPSSEPLCARASPLQDFPEDGPRPRASAGNP